LAVVIFIQRMTIHHHIASPEQRPTVHEAQVCRVGDLAASHRGADFPGFEK